MEYYKKSSYTFDGMKEILERIRIIRVTKGFSQEYMSAVMGITNQSYSSIETGKTVLKVVDFMAICTILGVKMVDILKEIESEKSAQIVQEPAATYEKNVSINMDLTNPEQLKTLQNLLENFQKKAS